MPQPDPTKLPELNLSSSTRIIDCFSQPKAKIGGHLIISTSPGVQFSSRVPYQLHQARLHKRMNVFEFTVVEISRMSVVPRSSMVCRPSLIFVASSPVNTPARSQAIAVGDTGTHIGGKQSAVETERAVKINKTAIWFAGKSASPQVFGIAQFVSPLRTSFRLYGVILPV